MDDCLFCKIVAKQIPADLTYEDEDFLAFLDIRPMTLGHSLLIPKKHFTWMPEVPDDLIAQAFILAKKIMAKMLKDLPCDYVQILIIGKDVPHFHIHLIPRHLEDKLPHFENLTYEGDQKNEFLAKLKN